MTDTDKIGTLRELDVKPGDVVVLADDPNQEQFECIAAPPRNTYPYGDHWDFGIALFRDEQVRLISRASPPIDLTAITTPFGLLPPETQQAMRDHGGPYEMYQREGWWKIEPVWVPQLTYRVKPAPKRETVTIYGAPALGVQWVYTQCEHDTHRITFDLIDGTPDPASIRMEEL